MTKQNLKKLQRRFPGARVDLPRFEKLFRDRLADPRIKVAKALEANFEDPQSEQEQRIQELIVTYRTRTAAAWQPKLFEAKARLAKAQRKLKDVPAHKGAQKEIGVATRKVDDYLRRLENLERTEPKETDARIFPFYFLPIVLMDDAGPVIVPARYHLRPNGFPSSFDREFSGCYNARRNNLSNRVWKRLFGASHAVCVVTSFFEHVEKHDYEKRPLAAGEDPQDLVLHFTQQPPKEMLVACLYDRWGAPDDADSFFSFAMITDDPPSEIAETGHDRVILPVREDNIEAWLRPAGAELASVQKLLDERESFYYAHELAA